MCFYLSSITWGLFNRKPLSNQKLENNRFLLLPRAQSQNFNIFQKLMGFKEMNEGSETSLHSLLLCALGIIRFWFLCWEEQFMRSFSGHTGFLIHPHLYILTSCELTRVGLDNLRSPKSNGRECTEEKAHWHFCDISLLSSFHSG